MKDRLIYIDNLKGFLILLVILGHCIQMHDSDFDNNILFRYIYSFHMPLFIYVSGFLSYKVTYKWIGQKNRFFQCVVPFVAWSMLSLAMNGEYNWNWLINPDSSLWFLWVIFWIGFISVIFSKIAQILQLNELIMLGIVCLVALFSLVFYKPVFGFHLVAYYLPFYYIGICNRRFLIIFDKFYTRCKNYLPFVFLILAFFWMRNQSPTFMSSSNLLVIFGYKFFVGIVGCFTFMSWAPIVLNTRIPYVYELGGMTLGIYAIHQSLMHLIISFNFLYINNINNFSLRCIWMFILTIGCTITLYFILDLFRLTKFVFLGKSR